MEVFCGEAALAPSLKLPFQLAGRGVHGIEVAIKTAEINNACGNRGRRGDAACGLEFPLERPGGEIQSIERMITAAKVEFVARNRRGREDLSLGVKLLLDSGELGNAGSSINTGVLRIAAKHDVLRKRGQRRGKKSKQEKPFHEQCLRSPHRRIDSGNLSRANPELPP